MTKQSTVAVHIPTLNRYLDWIEGLRATNSSDLVTPIAHGRSEPQIRDAALEVVNAYEAARSSAGSFAALKGSVDAANYRRTSNGVIEHGTVLDGGEIDALWDNPSLLGLITAISNLHTTYFGGGTSDLGFEDHPRVGHAGPVEYDPAFAVRGGPSIVWG